MKNLNSLILLILTIGSLWSMFYYKSQIKSSTEKVTSLTKELLIYKYNYQLSKYSILDESSPHLEKIDIIQVEQSIKNLSSVKLLEVVKSPKLVFRISDNHCSECLYKSVNILKKKFDYNPLLRMNTIILADFSTISSLKAWAETNKMDLPLFFIQNKKHILNSDREMKPYLFMFTRDGKVSSLHIPIKENMEFTDEYIS